jgi:GntR family transcriptional regulator / MocR family aminotransferase
LETSGYPERNVARFMIVVPTRPTSCAIMDSSAPPPQLPLTIRRRGSSPLQSQIAEQIHRLVSEGILAPAHRVPSTRALSEQLGVSRNTVTLAYELLIAEGILEVESSAGTLVSRKLPAGFVRVAASTLGLAGGETPAKPRPRPAFLGRGPRVRDPLARQLPYDFRLGQPDPALFPATTWRRLIADNLSRAELELVRYGDPGGLMALRVAIARHLKLARGIDCEPDQVVITAGCQEGLNLVARVLVNPGAEAVVENPCYEGAALAFSSYGAKLVPGPIDDEGLCVDRLPSGPVLAYVTPSHQFPLGPTLSFARRLALLEWASSSRAYLVEDDYDSDFRYEGSPLLALYALDRSETTIYLGTFSKSIGAGLRLGYVVFPRALVPAAIGAKALLNNGHPWLEQAAAAEFLDSGGFERHLQRIRRSYAMRRECLLFELHRRFGACRVDGAEGGMHVVWHLPAGAPSAREVQRQLVHEGVGVYSLAEAPVHFIGELDAYDSVLLLGYPCLDEDRIRAALQRIARVLERKRKPRAIDYADASGRSMGSSAVKHAG